MPDRPSPARAPSRRVLKGAILWCARWMMGDGDFYAGSNLRIEITTEGERVAVEPSPRADGLSEPEPVGVAPSADVQAEELIRVLFSRDEMRILSELLGEAPVKATAVRDATGIKNARFWELWGNLQQRGVVTDAEGGEGFAIGPAWVKQFVTRRAESKPAA